MVAAITLSPETLLGSRARCLRLALNISQKELAVMAAIPLQAVDLFEHNFPVPLDYRRRILKVLWAAKARG